MTPFAQLQVAGELEKSSAPLLRGAHNLMRNGFWKTIANNQKYAPDAGGWRGRLGRSSRLFHDPNAGKMVDGKLTGKSTLLSKGLTGYGLAGIGASVAGYNLPGSSLAMNATMPGVGALFTAAPAITSARLATKGNQAKVVEDLKVGAREAAGDLMSLTETDPRFATHADLYGQFMQRYAPGQSPLAAQYRDNTVKPMSKLQMIGNAFEDPQALLNNQIDQRIAGEFHKSAAGGLGALRALKTGAGHVFPWLFPTAGVGMAGHALLSEKPYDATQAQSRGYAGAQAKMQEKMQTLNPMERMALRFDPSIIGRQAEQVLPGTIAQWEQRGKKYQPGMISRAMDSWTKGGENNYYEYDGAGQRKYL